MAIYDRPNFNHCVAYAKMGNLKFSVRDLLFLVSSLTLRIESRMKDFTHSTVLSVGFDSYLGGEKLLFGMCVLVLGVCNGLDDIVHECVADLD